MGQVVWIACLCLALGRRAYCARSRERMGRTSAGAQPQRAPSLGFPALLPSSSNSCPVTHWRTGHSGGMLIRLSLGVMVPSITAGDDLYSNVCMNVYFIFIRPATYTKPKGAVGARPRKASWRRRQKGGGELVHGVQVQVHFDFSSGTRRVWWLRRNGGWRSRMLTTSLTYFPLHATPRPRPMSSQAAGRYR